MKIYPSHLLTILVTLLICSASNSDEQEPPRPTPLETMDEIKTSARELVAMEAQYSVSSIVKKPAFQVDETSKTLTFRVGRVREEAEFTPDSPYSIVFAKQVHLESLIRELVPSASSASYLWSPRIQSAQNVIRQMVWDVEATPDNKELTFKLQKRNGEFQNELSLLKQGMAEYAAKEGLEVVGGRTPASDGFSVTITTEPPGGTIRYITAFEYDMDKHFGRQRPPLEYLTLSGNPHEMVGVYYFWVKWSDGRQHHGLEDFYGPQVCKLKPDN